MQRDLRLGGRMVRVEVNGDAWTIDGAEINVNAERISQHEMSLLVDGRAYRCLLDISPTEQAVIVDGVRYVFSVEDPRTLKGRKRGAAADGPLEIKSSMPGRVLRLLAAEGDAVEPGQGLVVVEAMKMQNEMKSPRAGRVRRIAVGEGETVNAGQLLAVIE